MQITWIWLFFPLKNIIRRKAFSQQPQFNLLLFPPWLYKLISSFICSTVTSSHPTAALIAHCWAPSIVPVPLGNGRIRAEGRNSPLCKVASQPFISAFDSSVKTRWGKHWLISEILMLHHNFLLSLFSPQCIFCLVFLTLNFPSSHLLLGICSSCQSYFGLTSLPPRWG